MKRLRLLLLLPLCAPQLAIAQAIGGATGSIEGTIRDADGRPLLGASVVVVGPARAGRRQAATDEHGRYRVAALPVGTYRVEATLAGYSGSAAERLRVDVDEVLRADFELASGAASSFTISAQSLVDVVATGDDDQLRTDELTAIPKRRTTSSLLDLAAGVVPDRQAGTAVESVAGVAIEGASIAEHSYFLDGMEVTDPRLGTVAQETVFELVDVIQVKTSGASAEYGGTLGGVVNVVTRSGSASWQGGITLQYADDRLAESPSLGEVGELERLIAASDLASAAEAESIDGGAWFGGSVSSDLLWLFAGYMPQHSQLDSRAPSAVPTPLSSFEVDGGYGAGKLSWRPADAFYIDLAHNRTDFDLATETANRGGGPADRSQQARTSSARLDWVLSPVFELEVFAGRFDRDLTGPAPGSRSLDRLGLERTALAVAGTLFFRAVGDHTLKLGLQLAEPRTRLDGRGWQVEPVGGRYRTAGGRVESENRALYLQDAWRIDERWTLSLGVRASREKVEGGPDEDSPIALGFDYEDKLAPRLGFAYDVLGDGHWKLYGSAGLYYDTLKHELALGAGESESESLDRVLIDPELEPERTFEANLGTEQQLLPNLTVGGELTYRELADSVQLLGLIPGGSGSVIEAVVNPGTGLGLEPYGPAFPPHPGLEREYFAFELGATARFRRWIGTGSYVLTFLDGNYDGLANADDLESPIRPNLSGTCRFLEGCFTAAGLAADGRLSVHRPHQIRLHGSYRFESGLSLGGFFRFYSGTPFEREVDVLTALDGDAPALVRLVKPEGRRRERHNAFTQLDLRLQYELELGRGRSSLSLFADVFNLFDADAALNRWQNAYLEPIVIDRVAYFAGFDADRLAAAQGLTPDPRFGQVVRRQTSRRIRLGVTWRW